MKKEIVYPVLLVVVSLVAGLAIGLTIVRKPRHEFRPRVEGRSKMDYRIKESRMPRRDEIFDKISDRLKLSSEQEGQIKKILTDSREEAKTTIEKSKDALLKLKEKTNAQIKGVLTKEQQVEFDRMTAEIKDRIQTFKNKMRGLRPGPLGGQGPREGFEQDFPKE